MNSNIYYNHKNIRYFPLIALIIIKLISYFLTSYLNVVYANNRYCNIFIENKQKKLIMIKVEIAETAKSRKLGLMFRNKLNDNEGMLFIFPDEGYQSFWMKNTTLELSIAYINSKGVITKIDKMKPLDTSITYTSSSLSLYALEVNTGWFRKNNISEGCRIIFNGCINK